MSFLILSKQQSTDSNKKYAMSQHYITSFIHNIYCELGCFRYNLFFKRSFHISSISECSNHEKYENTSNLYHENK